MVPEFRVFPEQIRTCLSASEETIDENDGGLTGAVLAVVEDGPLGSELAKRGGSF